MVGGLRMFRMYIHAHMSLKQKKKVKGNQTLSKLSTTRMLIRKIFVARIKPKKKNTVTN